MTIASNSSWTALELWLDLQSICGSIRNFPTCSSVQLPENHLEAAQTRSRLCGTERAEVKQPTDQALLQCPERTRDSETSHEDRKVHFLIIFLTLNPALSHVQSQEGSKQVGREKKRQYINIAEV